jgi:hypothetical protein
MVIRPDANGAEESGEHKIATGDVARAALRHEIVADDTKM